jgi:hypothetical protein
MSAWRDNVGTARPPVEYTLEPQQGSIGGAQKQPLQPAKRGRRDAESKQQPQPPSSGVGGVPPKSPDYTAVPPPKATEQPPVDITVAQQQGSIGGAQKQPLQPAKRGRRDAESKQQPQQPSSSVGGVPPKSPDYTAVPPPKATEQPPVDITVAQQQGSIGGAQKQPLQPAKRGRRDAESKQQPQPPSSGVGGVPPKSPDYTAVPPPKATEQPPVDITVAQQQGSIGGAQKQPLQPAKRGRRDAESKQQPQPPSSGVGGVPPKSPDYTAVPPPKATEQPPVDITVAQQQGSIGGAQKQPLQPAKRGRRDAESKQQPQPPSSGVGGVPPKSPDYTAVPPPKATEQPPVDITVAQQQGSIGGAQKQPLQPAKRGRRDAESKQQPQPPSSGVGGVPPKSPDYTAVPPPKATEQPPVDITVAQQQGSIGGAQKQPLQPAKRGRRDAESKQQPQPPSSGVGGVPPKSPDYTAVPPPKATEQPPVDITIAQQQGSIGGAQKQPLQPAKRGRRDAESKQQPQQPSSSVGGVPPKSPDYTAVPPPKGTEQPPVVITVAPQEVPKNGAAQAKSKGLVRSSKND